MRSVTLAPTITASQTGNPSSPSRSVRGRGGRSHAAGDARSRFGRTHPLSGRRLPASSCGGGYSTSEGHEPSDDGGRSSKRFPEGRRSGDVGGAEQKTNYKQLPARSHRRGDASKILPFAQRGGREQAERARRGCPYPDTGAEARGAHAPRLSAPIPPLFASAKSLPPPPLRGRLRGGQRSETQEDARRHLVSPASGGNVRGTKGDHPITAHHKNQRNHSSKTHHNLRDNQTPTDYPASPCPHNKLTPSPTPPRASPAPTSHASQQRCYPTAQS